RNHKILADTYFVTISYPMNFFQNQHLIISLTKMNASLLNVSHRNNNITLNNNIYYNYDYLSRRIRESEPLP
ncbi:hypothetical protein DLS08_13895, partial [Escherichia coli]|nr:hypothetical protein [Escherichia coli]